MSLKPARITISLPPKLLALAKRRAEEERYHSFSDYINGLVVFCVYARKPHLLTGPLLKEPYWLVEKVVDQLAIDFDTLPPDERPGGWFKERVDELVAKAKAEGEPTEPKKPRVKKSAEDLIKRATKKKTE